MKSYLDIVANVLNNGIWKKPVRRNPDGTEVVLPYDTLALPNQVFSHHLADGFPLLTTKKMPLRTILVELEGFINGITSKKWYQDRGCKIWNEWANPEAVNKKYEEVRKLPHMTEKQWNENDLKKVIALEIDDLGPIYGYQWRKFGVEYPEYIGYVPPTEYSNRFNELEKTYKGTDQLKNIVDTLHNNPYDRRMVCSAWNPNQIDQMALPPCHYAWNVTVIGDEINLAWVQRSVDVGLGLCFNIASYASLLLLLAKESGFKPGNLTGLLVDCHIYRNQIEGLQEQLKREPYQLPTLEILNKKNPFLITDAPTPFSIFTWEHTDVKLHNYISHNKVDLGAITV